MSFLWSLMILLFSEMHWRFLIFFLLTTFKIYTFTFNSAKHFLFLTSLFHFIFTFFFFRIERKNTLKGFSIITLFNLRFLAAWISFICLNITLPKEVIILSNFIKMKCSYFLTKFEFKFYILFCMIILQKLFYGYC